MVSQYPPIEDIMRNQSFTQFQIFIILLVKDILPEAQSFPDI